MNRLLQLFMFCCAILALTTTSVQAQQNRTPNDTIDIRFNNLSYDCVTGTGQFDVDIMNVSSAPIKFHALNARFNTSAESNDPNADPDNDPVEAWDKAAVDSIWVLQQNFPANFPQANVIYNNGAWSYGFADVAGQQNVPNDGMWKTTGTLAFRANDLSECFEIFWRIAGIHNTPKTVATEFESSQDQPPLFVRNHLVNFSQLCYQQTCNLVPDARDPFNAANNTDTIFRTVFFNTSEQYCIPVVDQPGDLLVNDTIVFPFLDGADLGTTSPIFDDTCFTYTAGSVQGEEVLRFRICDEGGLCDTTTIIINVRPDNFAPNHPDPDRELAVTDEDTPIEICFDDVVDPDNDPVDVTGRVLPAGPFNGVMSGANDGDTCFTYTPNQDFFGEDSLQVLICDNASTPLCDTVTVVITVNPVNDRPVAGPDNAVTPEDVCVTIPVQDNDTDVDDTNLSTFLLGTPANGNVSLVGDSIRYCPDLNYNGGDNFTYLVCDGSSCDTGFVNVVITPVNDGPELAADSVFFTIPIGQPDTNLCIDNAVDVEGDSYELFANGNDIDCISFSPTSTAPFANGATDADSCFIVDAENCVAPEVDYLYFFICPTDEQPSAGNCDTVVAVINVVVDNFAPEVANDEISVTTPEDTPVEVCVTDATDADGDNIDITGIADAASNGTISGLNDGDTCFTYTPNLNFNGLDTVAVLVCDDAANQLCDTVTVFINVTPVNDRPVAVNDTVTTPEDVCIVVPVQANDTDVDDVNLNTFLLGPANNGNLTLQGDDIRYCPDLNFFGNDNFDYLVCDGSSCDTATVFVTVTPVNDGPELAADTVFYTIEIGQPDTTLCIDNAVDVEGDSYELRFRANNSDCVEFSPSSVAPFGSSSRPDSCFVVNAENCVAPEVDLLEFYICPTGEAETAGNCDTVVAVINVIPDNIAPEIGQNEVSVVTPEDTPVEVCVTDATDADGDALDITGVVLNPLNGSISGLNDGDTCFTYTPDPNFNGTDSVKVVVCDPGNLCDTLTVIIIVNPVNDAPIAVDDQATVPEDGEVVIDVQNNDIDPDGDNLITIEIVDAPANGTPTILSNDSIRYEPDADFNGIDLFTYRVCDPSGLCDTAQVLVNVTPINDAPDFPGNDTLNLTTDENEPVSFCFDGVIDIDGDDVDVTDEVTTGANGSVSIFSLNQGDTCFTYVPNVDFFGSDVVEIAICDDGSPVLCDTITVNITVNRVVEIVAPTPNDTAFVTIQQFNPDTTICLGYGAGGAGITSTISNNGNLGNTTTIVDDTCFTYSPSNSGSDTITIVSCAAVNCDTISFVIEVTPIPNVRISPKAILFGAYNIDEDKMTSELGTAPALGGDTVLPLTQPYNVAPWNYPGTESIPNRADLTIIDWVLVEFRSGRDISTVISTQAALVHEDGDIRTTSGQEVFEVPFTPGDSIYTVIRHRHHTAARHTVPVTVANGVINLIDFRVAPVSTGCNCGIVELEDLTLTQPTYAIIGADADNNNQISASDLNIYAASFSFSGTYDNSDWNFDADVNAVDYGVLSEMFGEFSSVDQ